MIDQTYLLRKSDYLFHEGTIQLNKRLFVSNIYKRNKRKQSNPKCISDFQIKIFI